MPDPKPPRPSRPQAPEDRPGAAKSPQGATGKSGRSAASSGPDLAHGPAADRDAANAGPPLRAHGDLSLRPRQRRRHGPSGKQVPGQSAGHPLQAHEPARHRRRRPESRSARPSRRPGRGRPRFRTALRRLHRGCDPGGRQQRSAHRDPRHPPRDRPRRGPKKSLLALGYAGWGPGQLDAEMQANGWLHVDADEALVFDPNSKDKWQQALAKIGIDLTALSGDAGHA